MKPALKNFFRAQKRKFLRTSIQFWFNINNSAGSRYFFLEKKTLIVYIIRRFKVGGRGSRSSGGNRAPNGYSTVGEIRGVRVIQDKKTGKGLPFYGPKNGSFYRKSRSGAVEQYRKYDSKGFPKKDIDTGHDHGQGDPHVHDWVNGKRQVGRPPTIGELNKIKFK